MATVPSQYQQDVHTAATNLGIPDSVVAAQIDLESSWNPNAVSPAGAQGIAQFEPGTWAQYGSGSPFNVNDAFAAYIRYMKALLQQEGGDLRKALEAYNAGPGNLPAGSGYATTILNNAGDYDLNASGGASASGPSAPGTGTDAGNTSNSLFQWPSEIIGFFSDIDRQFTAFYRHAALFFQPSTYVRMGAGMFGTLFIVLGIVCLAREAKET